MRHLTRGGREKKKAKYFMIVHLRPSSMTAARQENVGNITPRIMSYVSIFNYGSHTRWPSNSLMNFINRLLYHIVIIVIIKMLSMNERQVRVAGTADK